MKYATDKNLIHLANALVRRYDNIQVLKANFLDQYSPLVRLVEGHLSDKHAEKKLLLPELRTLGNETIGIFSDYGGESSESGYFTYSMLVCGWNHSHLLFPHMEKLREVTDLEKKEIEFKSLEYGPIKRNLKTYLTYLDQYVVGLLYTVIIDKEIDTLFVGLDDSKEDIKRVVKESGYGDWKPKVLEKLLRIIHLSAYLVGLLSGEGQKVFWMTDHDNIAANSQKHKDMMGMFHSILQFYIPHSLDLIGYATPYQERDTNSLDLLSSTDLVAGSIEHYFTNLKKSKDSIKKAGVETILQWLGHDGLGLKKQTLLIEKKDKGYIGRDIEFKPNETNGDIQIVPVPV